jgi:hypothetical protein
MQLHYLVLISENFSVKFNKIHVNLWKWQGNILFVKRHKVKRKVKCALVQAPRLCTGRTAHSGSTGKALLFLDHGTRRGWGVSVMPRLLCSSPGKTRYPLYRRQGGPQSRSGQVQKISPPPGFDPQTIQSVASHYTDYATRPMTGVGR